MEHKRQYIGTGDKANLITCKVMQRLAIRDSKNAYIKDIASELKEQAKGNEELLCRSIFDYVYDRVKYDYDHNNIVNLKKYLSIEIDDPMKEEFVQAPIYLLQVTKVGDCDDMSTAVASIAIACNVSVNFKMIAINGNHLEHIYAELLLKNTFPNKTVWVPCDPVIKKFGTEKRPYKRHVIFPVWRAK